PHFGPDRMEPVGEGGDDAEVAAAAAQRPEQVGVLARRGVHLPPVGEYEVGGFQVVRGQPVVVAQPAEPAAEGVPGDAGVADHAAGGGQPVRLRGGVEVGPGRAAVAGHPAAGGVDVDQPQAAQVDHEAAVGHGRAGGAVAAAAHGDLQVLLPAVGDRGGHVVGAVAPYDHGGAAVDGAVPDLPDDLVLGVPRGEHAPGASLAQPVDSAFEQLNHVRTPRVRANDGNIT